MSAWPNRMQQTVSAMARLKALPAGQSRSPDVGNDVQRSRSRSAVLVAGLLALLSVGGCRVSRTTDTRSSQLSSDAEKVEFLSRYMAFKSTVQAAEFHVVYHDNSGGLVPGPSDGEIQAVVKVRPRDVGLWVSGMQRSEIAAPEEGGRSLRDELEWGYKLLPESPFWRVSSQPVVFTAAGGAVLVAAFETEGVVMTRILEH
jgi:hypothetical protein